MQPLKNATTQDAPPVRYRYTLLRAGQFALDGGSMFGLIPRVVWSRQCQVDDRGRIAVQHNCLLLERLDGPPAGSNLPAPKLVLIETGTGDKLDAKSRDIFALEDRSISTALHEVNCDPANIATVICSHLHFDHAGGLTRLAKPGETPDWTGPASSFGSSVPDRPVKRTFPNAELITQLREWRDAMANRSVMTRTYFQDHLAPMAEHVRFVESPPPFAPGLIPDRTQLPSLPPIIRETEVLPGIFVFLVPGHTWGQQAIKFFDHTGQPTVFTPDVLPTSKHVGQAYSLAYDVEPYTSSVSRHWFLQSAVDKGWKLVLDHEHGHPTFTVKPGTTPQSKGWFELEPA